MFLPTFKTCWKCYKNYLMQGLWEHLYSVQSVTSFLSRAIKFCKRSSSLTTHIAYRNRFSSLIFNKKTITDIMEHCADSIFGFVYVIFWKTSFIFLTISLLHLVTFLYPLIQTFIGSIFDVLFFAFHLEFMIKITFKIRLHFTKISIFSFLIFVFSMDYNY